MSFFITFEGVEGCGKTTQLTRLKSYLEKLGNQVVTTREPGGCQISNSIRALVLDPASTNMTPHTELLLYAASRAQHVSEVIRPALDAGKIVLCDRFFDATRVYQGAGRGVDVSLIDTVNLISCNNLEPDLTLLLDFPVEQGLQRARERNQSEALDNEGRFELESLAFHQKVRNEYLTLSRELDRFRIVDALGTIAEVEKRVVKEIDLFLATRQSA
jgi:dTMP kinase